MLLQLFRRELYDFIGSNQANITLVLMAFVVLRKSPCLASIRKIIHLYLHIKSLLLYELVIIIGDEGFFARCNKNDVGGWRV